MKSLNNIKKNIHYFIAQERLGYIDIFALSFGYFTLIKRSIFVFLGGGLVDRTQFFIDGALKPDLFDFIFNELFIFYFLLKIIIYRPRLYLIIPLILSGFIYFNRIPFFLLGCAILCSRGIGVRLKLASLSLVTLISAFLIWIRVGADITQSITSLEFFVKYPLVGFWRLYELDASMDVTLLQIIQLIVKPIDAIFFVYEYTFAPGTNISIGRYVGGELSLFVYIQSLEGYYNAFGTILYPFIFACGWSLGLLTFSLSIIFMVFVSSLVTGDAGLALRYALFLLLSGFLLSWSSPFPWLAPMFYAHYSRRTAVRTSKNTS